MDFLGTATAGWCLALDCEMVTECLAPPPLRGEEDPSSSLKSASPSPSAVGSTCTGKRKETTIKSCRGRVLRDKFLTFCLYNEMSSSFLALAGAE